MARNVSSFDTPFSFAVTQTNRPSETPPRVPAGFRGTSDSSRRKVSRPAASLSGTVPDSPAEIALLRRNRAHIWGVCRSVPFHRLGQLDGHLHARLVIDLGIRSLQHGLLHRAQQVRETRILFSDLIDPLIQLWRSRSWMQRYLEC